MDFNLILLLAGLGLLAVVALCALLGYFCGLKRELTCIAVFIVLLVLTWLVFGDAATLLNANIGQTVAGALGINDNSIVTLWDAILAFAKTVIPNGEVLLVEGKETYSLCLSIASAVCRAAGLIVGTVAILIICPIIRLITFIVRLIIKKVKANKAKAKEEQPEKTDMVVAEEEKVETEQPNDMVVESEENSEEQGEQVIVNEAVSGQDAVVTKDENELDQKPSRRPILGAIVGGVKALFVMMLVCVPFAGLSSIVETISPETKNLLDNVVEGNVKVELSEEQTSSNPVDMVFDLVDAYDKSILGVYDGISGFFFKETFGEKLFDQMLKIETDDQKMYLSEELEVFINAINGLEGNTNFTTISKESFANVLNALKDSKLLVEAMPAAVELVSEMEQVKELIGSQNMAFLELRYINWDKDIESFLDAVIEAYDLGLFPIKDLNYLTLDVKELRDVTTILGQTELMTEAYPLIAKVVFQMEKVKEIFGDISNEIKTDDLNIATELDAIVDIYAKFQEFGITSLENLDTNALISDILNNPTKKQTFKEIVYDALDLQLAQTAAVPALFGFLDNNEKIHAQLEQANVLDNTLKLKDEFDLNDVKLYVDAIFEALELVDTSNYPTINVDYLNLEPTKLTKLIDKLFKAKSANDVITIAAQVAFELDAVKNLVGEIENLTLEGVDWQSELNLFVDIYSEFLNLGFKSLDDFKQDTIELVKEIVNDEAKMTSVENILNKLTDAQIYSKVVTPIMQFYLDKILTDKDFNEFKDIIDVKDLTTDQWKEDFSTILDIVKDVNDLGILDNLNPFDFNKLDITSEEGSTLVKEIISKVFDLNILGDDKTKTDLLLATIEKYQWTKLADDFDASKINWENELNVILDLVDILVKVDQLEEFDIHDIANADWAKLLNDEDNVFVDYVVEALEELIESKVFLEVLPGVIDKYLLPKLNLGDDFDDSQLIADIIKKFDDGSQGSKELVEEIIKLVDVVKAMVELNLLDIKEQGFEVVDLSNTDAFRTIVNGIFDSKLINGFEGRVIRIILKLTNVLDIEKDSDLYNQLINIDFEGEQEILINFINAVEPVLQDKDFSIFDENGQLKVDVKFWTTDKNAKALLNAIDVLFGAYEDENATGSKLAEVLLPSLYDKFVEEKDIIPAPYNEIVEILDVTNASGADLMHDVSCLTYIIDKLVELNALSLVDDGDFNITDQKAQNIICEIIDVLYEIELFKGNETEFVQWCVNFAFEKFELEFDLNDELNTITSGDWATQKDEFKEVLVDIINYLHDNCGINTYKDVVNYFGKDVLVDNVKALINVQAIDELTDILNKLIDIKLFKVVIPDVSKELFNVLKDNGYDFTFVIDVMSNDGKYYDEFIIDDLHKLFDIIDFAAKELSACEIYNTQANGDINLPEVEKVQELIDDLFGLTIVNASHGTIATFLYETFVPKLLNGNDEIVKIDKYEFYEVNWKNEVEVIKNLVAVAYDLVEAVNCPLNIKDIREFIANKEYEDINMIREEVADVLSDALRILSKSNVLENVIDDLYNYGIFQIADNEKLPFTIEYLRDVPSNLLMQDVNTLADILDKAVEFGILEYVKDQNITKINTEKAAVVIESLYALNIIKENEQELFFDLYNYVLTQLGKAVNYKHFEVTQAQIASINFEQEFKNVANVVRELDGLLKAKFIKDLNSLLDLVKEQEYTKKSFFNETTVKAIVDIIDVAKELQLVELITPQLINYVVDMAKGYGIDLKFMSNNVYPSLVFDDIMIILNTVCENLDESKLLDLVFDSNMDPLINEGIFNIIDCLPKLQLMKLYSDDVFASLTKALYKTLNINKVVLPSAYDKIDIEQEINTLKEILLAAKEVLEIKDINAIDLIKYYVDGKFYYTKDVLDDCYLEVQELLNKVLDLQYLKVAVSGFFDHYFGDENGLAGKYTGEQLISDVRIVVNLIDEFVEAGLVNVVFGDSFTTMNLQFDKYIAILESLKELQVVQNTYKELAKFGFNFLFNKLGIEASFEVEDFAQADYQSDMTSIINAVKEFETLAKQLDAISIDEFIAKAKEITNYSADYRELAENALDLVEALIDVKVARPAYDEIAQFVISKNDKVKFLLENLTDEQLLSDLQDICSLAHDVLDYGVIEFIYADGTIDVSTNGAATINGVLDKLFGLNVVSNGEEKIVEYIVKLADGESIVLDDVTLEQEVKELKDVVNALYALLDKNELNSMPAIKEFFKFGADNSINDVLNNNYQEIKTLLQEVVESKIFVAALPMTVKLVLKGVQNGEFAYLMDNVTGAELIEDIKTIITMIEPLVDSQLVELGFGLNPLTMNLAFEDYKAVLEGVKNLNILNNNWYKLGAYVVNRVNELLGNNTNITEEEFAHVVYEQDLQDLIDAVTIFEAVCKHLGVTRLDEFEFVIKNYRDIEVSNDTLLAQVLDIAKLANSVETLHFLYPAIVSKVTPLAADKGFDIEFLFEGLNGDALAADIDTVVNALYDVLVEYGIFEYLFMNGSISYDDTSIFAEVVENIANLNVLQGENGTKLLELVLTKAGLIEKAELNLITDREAETQTLCNMVNAFVSFMKEKGLTSLNAFYELHFVKAYAEASFYDPYTGQLITDFLTSIGNSQIISAILPAVVNKVVASLNIEYLDFLKDLTAKELSEDILTLAKMVNPIINSELLVVVFGGKVEALEFNFDSYREIISLLGQMNIINKGYQYIVPVGLNFALDAVGSDYDVDAKDFENISFAKDMESINAMLDEIDELFVMIHATTVNDLIYSLYNLTHVSIANDLTASNVIDVLEALMDIETLDLSLAAFANMGTTILAKNGLDLQFLVEGQTSVTLTEDVNSIIDMLDKVVDYGVIDFLFMADKLDFENPEPITNIIDTLFNLNIIKGNEADLFKLALKALNIELSTLEIPRIDWELESLSLQDLIKEVAKLPVLINATYLDDIYRFNINSVLYVTQVTNDFLQVFANVLEIVANDQLVNSLVLPLSNKFLNNPGKYAGLIDLHNIYVDNLQVKEDLLAISCAINDLIELDMFKFLNGYIDFPFDRTDLIDDIIRDIFSLNYLNNGAGRFNTILQAVGQLINVDFSVVDASKVSLANDAELLCAMYDEFATILTDEDWLVKDISDVYPFAISKKLLTNYVLIDNFFDGLTHLVNTTLYTELSGLLKYALPLVEKAAPDFYNALELGDVSFEEMQHEALVLADIIKEMEKLEVAQMHKTYDFFTITLRDCIVNILNHLDDSTLLSDHINALANVIVEKFIYGKKLGNVTVPYGAFDIDAIDFKADKERLVQIVNECFDFMLYETYRDLLPMEQFVYGLHDLNDYVYSMTKNIPLYFTEEYRYVFYETIINIVLNSSLLQTNGLAIMQNVVVPMLKTDFDGLLNFDKFTNEEFASDLTSIGKLITQVRELGLYTVIRDEIIDYDQADEVHALFDNIAELNYLDHNLYAVIDYVDNKAKLPIKFAALKDPRFDHEYDIKLLGNIYEKLVPVLLEPGYVFIKRSVYEDFYKNKHRDITTIKDLISEYKYTFVEVYEEIVTMTSLPLLFDELMAFVNTKIPEKYRPIIEAMDIPSLTYDEIKEDLLISAKMLRTLVDLGIDQILRDGDLFWYLPAISTLNGTEVKTTNLELILLLIDQISSLNMLSNHAEITKAVLEVFNVDTTTMDLEQFTEADWGTEVEILKALIVEITSVYAPYGIHSYGEIKFYFTEIIAKLNTVDKLVKEAQAMYDMLDFRHFENIFNLLGDSQVLDEIFSPTFMALVYPKVPNNYKDLADLTEYKGTHLTEDFYYLADICGAIATTKETTDASGVEVKDDVENPILIDATATIIKSSFSLNFLTLKKDAIRDIIDRRLSADLSGIDVDAMDLKADGDRLALEADHVLYIFGMTDYFKNWRSYEHLGNTVLMSHVIELYKAFVDTTLIKEIAYWYAAEYPNKLVGFIPDIKVYEEADIDLLFTKLGVTLDGMLEMGVFSNTQIDFTNAAATDKFFAVFEYVYQNKESYMKHVNKIKTNVALIDIVPITYEGILKEEESPSIREIAKLVNQFIKDYKDSLKSNLLALSLPNCQDDIINLVYTSFDSKIVNQLLVPLVNGLVKIYTVEKVQLNILDGVDNEQFVNQFLPDMFNIIDALAPLGALENRFEYTDIDLIIDLLYSIVYNDSTFNHLEDITKYALCFAGIYIKTTDLSSINWYDEYAVFESALISLRDLIGSLNIKNPTTYQNNDIILGFAAAANHLESSQLLPYFLRQALEKIVKAGFGDYYDLYINRLYDATYTDQYMAEDFAKIDEILTYIAVSNMYNGGIISSEMNGYIELVTTILNLNFASGLEEDMIAKVLGMTPVLKSYAVDYSLITDWSTEKDLFINLLVDAADLYKVVELDNLTNNDLKNPTVQTYFLALVDAMSKSLIGQQLLPTIYQEEVYPVVVSDFKDDIDLSDPTNWVDQFTELFKYNDAL